MYTSLLKNPSLLQLKVIIIIKSDANGRKVYQSIKHHLENTFAL